MKKESISGTEIKSGSEKRRETTNFEKQNKIKFVK